MQVGISNKAILEAPMHKAEVRRVDPVPEVAMQEWQFSGDGKKLPITIKAHSRDEAIQKYAIYLNE